MGARGIGFAMGLLLLGGCAHKPAEQESAHALKPELFRGLLLAQKPDNAMSVIQIRDAAKDGQEVVVEGQIPPEGTGPFNPGLASFVLMAEADLEDPKIKEELACPEAAT
jgi:hypothetical protein